MGKSGLVAMFFVWRHLLLTSTKVGMKRFSFRQVIVVFVTYMAVAEMAKKLVVL